MLVDCARMESLIKEVRMGKMNNIQQQATEKVDEMVGTSEIPNEVYEDMIIDEARQILMERAEADCND